MQSTDNEIAEEVAAESCTGSSLMKSRLKLGPIINAKKIATAEITLAAISIFCLFMTLNTPVKTLIDS
jgi:hypothetical protein